MQRNIQSKSAREKASKFNYLAAECVLLIFLEKKENTQSTLKNINQSKKEQIKLIKRHKNKKLNHKILLILLLLD